MEKENLHKVSGNSVSIIFLGWYILENKTSVTSLGWIEKTGV